MNPEDELIGADAAEHDIHVSPINRPTSIYGSRRRKVIHSISEMNNSNWGTYINENGYSNGSEISNGNLYDKSIVDNNKIVLKNGNAIASNGTINSGFSSTNNDPTIGTKPKDTTEED